MTIREIRQAIDISPEHIEEAASMRAGEYGGEVLTWDEVIDRLERGSDEDWGTAMDSPAIKHLQREVRARLRTA
jgi:hypothetical protein